MVISFEYHRHSFSHIVEVQDAEKLVLLLDPVEEDGDAPRGSILEHEPKVPGRGHQGLLVRTLGLVLELAWNSKQEIRQNNKKVTNQN